MYDYSITKPKALFLSVNFSRNQDYDLDLAEGLALVDSAGYDVVEIIEVNRDKPDPTLFIGKGKADEIKAIVENLEPECLIINHNITAIQERNLDSLLGIKIVDRTLLILDIFAARASSGEGKLQIEMAKQLHLKTRLVNRWSDLDRQKGGIGLRGGPGEKQIELDRRYIDNEIKKLKKQLIAIENQRETQRKNRLRNGANAVAIVGYTNAGKSTLFNTITKANIYAENRLFATLQTTARKVFITPICEVVLSDTVGFIRDLPHKLVESFKATLEEAVHADILLHVVDLSDAKPEKQIESVNIVLKEIAADKIPQLIIYNKIDACYGEKARVEYNDKGEPMSVYISASCNLGLDLLRQAIVDKLQFVTKPEESLGLAYEPWKFK